MEAGSHFNPCGTCGKVVARILNGKRIMRESEKSNVRSGVELTRNTFLAAGYIENMEFRGRHRTQIAECSL